MNNAATSGANGELTGENTCIRHDFTIDCEDMRYLGIDYGRKKIGLALSDEAGTMGFPHSVIPTANALEEIRRLAEAEKVDALVFGDSLQLSGEANAVAKDAKAFADVLAGQLHLPLHFETEVFTSAEARRSPHKMARDRSEPNREPVDASAAAIILTSFLSHHHE